MSTTSPAATPVFSPTAQPFLVRRAAVLGAGTMGSRIAAHLANAGIPTLLLDLIPAGDGSAQSAGACRDRCVWANPSRRLSMSLRWPRSSPPATLKTTCQSWPQCDWVIEAVAENLAIKTALLARVVPHLAPHAMLTTNTSGLPMRQIAAGLAAHTGAVLRDALLQSAALYAAAGDDSDRGERCGRGERFCRLCRPHAGQAGGVCQRYAELHRQPHRHCGDVQRGAPDAGAGADASKKWTR